MDITENATMGLNVTVYVRTSTDGQTLAQQRAAVLADLPRGLGRPTILEEIGSGKDDNREQYSQLKEDIAHGKVKHLYVWALDRLGRNAREIMEFVHLCIDNSVNLVSVKERLDLSSPWRDVFVAILATVADLEWQRISDRTKEKLSWYKERFGWKSHGSPPASAPILAEKVIRRVPDILKAHKAGLTIRAIAKAYDVTTKTVMKVIHRGDEVWMTRQQWVKANPNWYRTPQDCGAPPSSRSLLKAQAAAAD